MHKVSNIPLGENKLGEEDDELSEMMFPLPVVCCILVKVIWLIFGVELFLLLFFSSRAQIKMVILST